MMIQHLTGGNDFERSLKTRRTIAFALLTVGIVGVVCYLLFVYDKDVLPDFAQGFYLGAASGISLGSAILLVRTLYLLGHPEEQRKARIRETDEREKAIKQNAFFFAGFFTFFAAAAALFVVLPFSRAAFFALLAVMVVYALAFLAAVAYYSKKL